jgi:hypothetical protein
VVGVTDPYVHILMVLERQLLKLQTSLAIISLTVQLWTQVSWVISIYFTIRNTLPKSGTFLLGHPVYIISSTDFPCPPVT